MEELRIDATSVTPLVRFDGSKGVLEIKGRSIEEGSFGFYATLMEYIDKYAKSPAANTEINIQLEYINTSSSRGLAEVLKKLDLLFQQGHKMTMNWYYEEDDEEIREAGEDFIGIVTFPCKMHPIPSE